MPLPGSDARESQSEGTPVGAARYSPCQHVVSVAHGDKTVLLDVVRGQYYSMNPVGGLIWASLCDGAAIDDVVSALSSQYDAPAHVLRADAMKLIDELRSASLVDLHKP